jgi:hypothetical protein
MEDGRIGQAPQREIRQVREGDGVSGRLKGRRKILATVNERRILSKPAWIPVAGHEYDAQGIVFS